MAVKRKFSWFFDFNTSPDKITSIKVTAGGMDVAKRLMPFFTAFKYYKLGSVKIKLLPASTLPVDPTGLSYEAGEQTVDPRDAFDAGLIRITNGESFRSTYLQPDATVPADKVRSMYYQMMLDNRWYKFNLQAGVQRYATPRFWTIGQVKQDPFPGSVVNIPTQKLTGDITSDGEVWEEQSATISNRVDEAGAHETLLSKDSSSYYGFFQTGVRQRMGWMPTDVNLWQPGGPGQQGFVVAPPEVELMRILLPMCYKTKYYYRAIVEETVWFKSPVNTMPIFETNGLDNSAGGDANFAYYMPDRFVLPGPPYCQSNVANYEVVDYDDILQNDGA